jgi:hypothetical protein
MAKLSVSVGDDLWQQAKQLSPDLGTSDFVQLALQEFVRLRGRRPRASNLGITLPPPSDAAALRDAALDGLRTSMVASYQDGYRDATKSIRDGVLAWEDLAPMPAYEWDITNSRHLLELMEGDLCRLDDPIYYEGFLKALQDVWEASKDVWEAPASSNGLEDASGGTGGAG